MLANVSRSYSKNKSGTVFLETWYIPLPLVIMIFKAMTTKYNSHYYYVLLRNVILLLILLKQVRVKDTLTIFDDFAGTLPFHGATVSGRFPA